MFDDSETVKILGMRPGTTDEVRDCEVTVGNSGQAIALWNEKHNDEEPLPILLDESKKRFVNGEPYWLANVSQGWVVDWEIHDNEGGQVFNPDLPDDPEPIGQVSYISAQTLRAEQMSTTIQDIADATTDRLMETVGPWALGAIIALLLFLTVVTLRGG
jgi:hypothetical protein